MAVPPLFVPGLELAGDFYTSAVRPLLTDEFPGLRYAAALLGPGSEVAGFDSQRSTDHDWGPRLQLLLPDEPGDGPSATITATLTRRLPESFRGYPVRFSLSGEPASAARHHVKVGGLGGWLSWVLGFDPRRGVTLLDWLATPAQRLAEFTTGRVFHDGPGELSAARDPAPGTRTTCGDTCLLASGSASTRRKPSPGGARRPATNSARSSSPPGWPGT
jgi:hypothetical protein